MYYNPYFKRLLIRFVLACSLVFFPAVFRMNTSSLLTPEWYLIIGIILIFFFVTLHKVIKYRVYNWQFFLISALFIAAMFMAGYNWPVWACAIPIVLAYLIALVGLLA